VRDLLSPKELALALGVSESSMKRWVDDGRIVAGRTAGGHRRIRVTDAIRFVREAGATVVHPEMLGLPDLNEEDVQVATDDASRLEAYLMEGKADEARGLVMSMYLAGRSVADICDGPIQTAMEHIGAIWQHNEEGIFIEHRASEICIQVLNQLRFVLEIPQPALAAVGGAAPGDPYILPTLAASTVLAGEGFASVNLGPNTPIESSRMAAHLHQACLVWLSLSLEQIPRSLKDDVIDLADELASIAANLVIGGRQSNRLAALASHPNITLIGSMSELAAFSRGIRVVAGSTPNTSSN
jgi:excisionase family DNA binding protein